MGNVARKAGFTATYVLLAVAFLSMLCINFYSYITVVNISDKYSKLNNAAMSFKLKVLNANLLFREIVSGYSGKDMNDVWTLIDDAKSYASYIAQVDAELKIEDEIADYKKVVLECYKAKNVDKPSPDLRRRYDKTINAMIQKIDTFEDNIKQRVGVKMGLVKLLYTALMINIVLIFAFTVFLLWRYDRKKRQSDNEMLAAHNDLTTLINTLDSILITVDQKGAILQWNPKAEKYFGLKPDVVIGRVLYNLIPAFKNYQTQVEAVFLSKRGKEHYHERFIIEAGHERFFNIIFTPITQPSKGISGVLIRADDITEQELRDEQGRQTQKMQIVENIIGGLAHDFNNVLGAITGTISMMRFSIESKNSIEDVKGNIELIEASAERAVVMVQQMLMFVQKQKAEMVQLDLNSSLLHVLRICQNSYDRRINIVANLYDVKACVKADPVQIALVILNLCDNAAQAMTSMRKEGEEQGGTLTISIDRICPDKAFRAAHLMATERSYWIISVKDTGVGIPPENISRVFDPFFTTKRAGEGAGLGLSIVSETVRNHSGFLEVSSEPGKGALFKIYLPEFILASAVDESGTNSRPLQLVKKAPSDSGIPVGSGLILIVDDEAIMRKTARNILEKLGYKTVCAEDGDEAVRIFSERHSEIVLTLLDLSMPKLSGKDAYVKMKEIDPAVKAMLVSGFKKDDRIQEALDLGMNAFVQKPYTMQVLAQEVKRVISGQGATPSTPVQGVAAKPPAPAAPSEPDAAKKA